MTTYCCGTGALSKLALGTTGGTITRMDFIDFNPTGIIKTHSDAGTKAIRGTLERIDTDVGEGILIVKFRTRLYMTAEKMQILLPMLGFTNVSTLWKMADSIPESTIIVGPAGAGEDTYTGCIPTDWMVMGQKGADPVMIDIGWIGKAYANASAGTFFTSQTSPAMTEGFIYPFGSGVNNTTSLTYNSNPLLIPQVRVSVNYHIVDEYLNSTTATNLCPTDHDITVSTSALYSTCDGTLTLFTVPMGGSVAGASAVLDFANALNLSGNQTQFNFANLKPIARPPKIIKNDFNRLPLHFRAYAQVQTSVLVPALEVTNVVGA